MLQGLCTAIKNSAAAVLVFLMLGTMPAAACDLNVTHAWIREAPPGLMTLAGYASLRNNSGKPLQIVKLWSASFAGIEMHESVIENGMASMREIKTLDIPARQQVTFAPGGRHFMLMGATQALRKGDTVEISLQDQHGCTTVARFIVRGDGGSWHTVNCISSSRKAQA